MAYQSLVDLAGTGGQSNFTFAFPYIAKEHIHVYVDSVETLLFTFSSDFVVTLDTALPVDSTVRVQRLTPSVEPLVDFSNGAVLGETDLDLSTLQVLYIMQETADADALNALRSLRVPLTEGSVSELPSVSTRKNTFLYFDGSGQPTAQVPILGDTLAFTPIIQVFSGDDVTTTFTMGSAPGAAASVVCAISGVLQQPGTDFNVSGLDIVFTTAPPLGISNIAVQLFGVSRLVDTVPWTGIQGSKDILALGGSTTRSLETQFGDYLNVKDYGVIGDGTADDSAALSAIATFPAYLPPGEYYMLTHVNGTGMANKTFIGMGGVRLSDDHGGFRMQTKTVYGVGAAEDDLGWDPANSTQSGKTTAIGTRALQKNTSGQHNTAVGDEALRLNTTGQQNTAVGMNALYTNVAGRDNVAVGVSALLSATGSYNTAVGRAAGLAVTTGYQNTLLGRDAGNNLTTGRNNTFLGDDVAHTSQDPDISDTVIIGRGAGYYAKGDQAVVIGAIAGANPTADFSQCVLIGYEAGDDNQALRTIAIGYQAGSKITTGVRNTCVGANALNDLVTGFANVAVGYLAGVHQLNESSVFIGDQAGPAVGLNAAYNNFIGAQAGLANTTGANNIFIGRQSGYTTTTGNDNIIIGSVSQGVAAGTSNQIILDAGTCLLTNKGDALGFYATHNATDGQGHIQARQHFKLFANGGSITTIANFFGTTSNIPLVSGGHYYIEAVLYFSKTSTEAVTVSLTNSIAPTSQNITWEQSPITGVVAPPGTATMLHGSEQHNTTAAKTIVTGSLTTGVNHRIRIQIQLENATGTSLRIQVSNPAGSLVPLRGSYWTSQRVPLTNTGTFAA